MESNTKICVLGSANFDYCLEIKDFPKEGETIQAHGYFTNNGGKVTKLKSKFHHYIGC